MGQMCNVKLLPSSAEHVSILQLTVLVLWPATFTHRSISGAAGSCFSEKALVNPL